MLVFLFLSLTLILAFIAIRLLRSCFYGMRRNDWPRLMLALSLGGFVYLYGAWVYLSIYFRELFILLFIAVLICELFRTGKKSNHSNLRSRPVLHGLLACLLLLLNVLYFTGLNGKPEIAELQFPLRAGKYFVLQGGKGLPANVFHFNSRRAVYAMDIVRLDKWGRRCSKVFSKSLEDYFIFGDTVFSPCDGVIERAVSNNPDNIPPLRKRGPNNLNGVVIAGGKYSVFLGHLQQHQVFVRAGDRVRAGQPLGLVGNSGISLEPHLHIQVHDAQPASEAWYRRPQLFIHFNGKPYLLFEEINLR